MKVLIVDDEILACQRLEKMLAELPEYQCVGLAHNGQQALEKIALLQPDIVLSDVRMPDMDGIELARLLKQSPHLHSVLIFTTAFEEHALQAFDLQVSGYLLKPVSKDKLLLALQRAGQLVESQKRAIKQYLSVSLRGQIHLIALDTIRVLQAEHKYVTVYHTAGESLYDGSLKMLEEDFPGYFQRVHRSALVAMQYVKCLKKAPDGQYYLEIEGVEIKPLVSRRLLSDVRQSIKQL